MGRLHGRPFRSNLTPVSNSIWSRFQTRFDVRFELDLTSVSNSIGRLFRTPKIICFAPENLFRTRKQYYATQNLISTPEINTLAPKTKFRPPRFIFWHLKHNFDSRNLHFALISTPRHQGRPGSSRRVPCAPNRAADLVITTQSSSSRLSLRRVQKWPRKPG